MPRARNFSSPVWSGRIWRGKFKNFPRRGGNGEDFVKIFPRRGRSGEDFFTKTYKFLAKSTNSSPKYTKMSQFPAMARKKSKFSSPGKGWREKKSKFSSPRQGWREKIWIFDPGNSRPAPPRLAKHRKMRSRRKKRRGLVGNVKIVMKKIIWIHEPSE